LGIQFKGRMGGEVIDFIGKNNDMIELGDYELGMMLLDLSRNNIFTKKRRFSLLFCISMYFQMTFCTVNENSRAPLP